MKKLFAICLFSIFAIQGCTSQTATNTRAPKQVPEFTFFTLKGNQPISRTSLALTGNVVFVFFDPGCSHCRVDIKAMGDNFEKIKDANFYLVSQQDPALVTDFMNTYGKGLQNKNNVTVLLDRNFEFLAKFNPVQYPSVYVYGQDRKLKTYFDGEQSVDFIIKSINQ